jgi:hypothetical protein
MRDGPKKLFIVAEGEKKIYEALLARDFFTYGKNQVKY